jgi:hypothetical protein
MYTCKFRVNYWKREKKTNGERERESNEEARVGGDNFNLQYYHTHT